MQIVLKRQNGWWIADDGVALFKAVALATEKADVAVSAVRKLFPGETVGLDSYSIGPATAKAFGPVVWLRSAS